MSTATSLRLLPVPDESKDKPLSSVIITFCKGSSYDALFSTVPQEAPDGKVHVYAAGLDTATVSAILGGVGGEEPALDPPELKMLADDFATEGVDVVVNFECCSACSDKGFGGVGRQVLDLTRAVLDKGWLLIFSDFSLKALITEWDEALLGPNPFEKLGEFGSKFMLRFDAETLRQCASSQLQTVGELCNEGHAAVHAMGGTVVYTLTPEATRSEDTYTVEVLTIQTEWGSDFRGVPEGKELTIGDHKGAAGHVILTYPTAGQIIASSGHWIELSRLDVSLESVVAAGRARYGSAYSTKIEKELRSYKTEGERDRAMQKYASAYVQRSTPARKGKYVSGGLGK